jgi:hypothetical protein
MCETFWLKKRQLVQLPVKVQKPVLAQVASGAGGAGNGK